MSMIAQNQQEKTTHTRTNATLKVLDVLYVFMALHFN